MKANIIPPTPEALAPGTLWRRKGGGYEDHTYLAIQVWGGGGNCILYDTADFKQVWSGDTNTPWGSGGKGDWVYVGKLEITR